MPVMKFASSSPHCIMCIITRSPVVPQGCKLPSKHAFLVEDTSPCPEQANKALAASGSTSDSTAACIKADVTFCSPSECTIVEAFSARILVVPFQAAEEEEQSCPVCTGKMTKIQALMADSESLPAHYVALPNGKFLKDPGLPELAHTHRPYHEPNHEFTFDPCHYQYTFRPKGYWFTWNHCCVLEHEQHTRPVIPQERLGLRLIMNQLQKYKVQGGGLIKAWNPVCMSRIPDVSLFADEAEGELHVRGEGYYDQDLFFL